MDQQLIATAAALLGALFAGTMRKVGSDLESAATTVMADRVAELVCRWLGPEHRLSKALEEAQGRPGKQPPPAGLEATLRELAETKPELLVELRRLLDPPQPPHQSAITIGSVDQRGSQFSIVGPTTINARSIGGPSPDSPDLVVGPPPDPADGPANLVLQGTIVVAGAAEINIIRGPSEPARQLEAVRGFVGRETELRWLRQQLRRRPGGAPMVMIVGEPGVGKTDLALMVANQLADEDYPDLQLQVGLSAAPPESAAPTDVGEVLRGILLALGKAPGEIPGGEVERANEYRSLLKPKRALVVLDGATSSHQVRTLEPPQGSAFIVTTRIAFSGPLERDAKPLWLGRLSRREAVALLAARVGSARVARQPRGAAQLVDACDQLPQALVVTAAFLASPAGRHARLRRVAADLRRRPLRPGTRLFALTAAFDLSYRQLPDQQRHTFQLLGLLNSAEVNLGAFARAADVTVDEAERRLGALATVSLVEGRPGRWRLRPLVLDYAHERADQELPGPARSDALQRALRYQLTQVRNQRRRIAEAAKLDPATATRLQADLDRELARGRRWSTRPSAGSWTCWSWPGRTWPACCTR